MIIILIHDIMTSVGILIYPKVEVLDFCGPFEVFRNVDKLDRSLDLEVFTIAVTDDIVDAQGLLIQPSYSFQNCPNIDILVIPGGNGSWLIEQQAYREFVMEQMKSIFTLLTVCTGALMPAKLGLIKDGDHTTTHQGSIELLRELAPTAKILPEVRFTESRNIIMSGGISAGIDATLFLVQQKWGAKIAQSVARYMEYDWRIREPDVIDPSLST